MNASTGSGGERGRRSAAHLMISVGVLSLALGAVLSVARRALFYPDAFAEHLAASLHDPRVAAFVGERMAGAVIEQEPDLTAFRPLIAATARGAVSSASFQALVRSGARAAHAALFSAGGRSVLVSVPDVGVLLRSALEKANPALAEKVPVRVQGVLASIGGSRVDRAVVRLWDVSRRSQWLAGILGFGGALLAAAGVLLAPGRQQALARLGLDLLVAAVALLALVPAGRFALAALARDELARGAAAGVWDAFTGSLRSWAFLLGGVGLVLNAAGRSLVTRFRPRDAARGLVAWIESPPDTTGGRLLRAALLLGVGTFALVWPASAAALVLMLLGASLAFAGLREVFEVVQPVAAETGSAAGPVFARKAGMRAGVVLGLAAVLVAAIAWIARPREQALQVSEGCNGAPELCARPLNEVVFPGSHNSMSSADVPDWMFPQQERGIAAQLEDGIRALLLDVHYGIPVEGRVVTDLDAETTSRAKLDQAVGKEGVDAAMRIRDRLAGKAQGPRGLYLCHGFCELGAIPLGPVLQRAHEFLVRNPGEVLVVVIEDYVAPQDLAAVFIESGLEGLVHRGPLGPPWPTLRELIDSRQRVLVLTESGRPGVPWLHPAFEVMQETPYHFEQPSELSCAPNRGGSGGSLFLVNNWIDTTPAPRPSNAAIVNAYEALLARARRCQKERRLTPTVIAVDFYRTGALFRVVRALNGLGGEAPAPPAAPAPRPVLD